MLETRIIPVGGCYKNHTVGRKRICALTIRILPVVMAIHFPAGLLSLLDQVVYSILTHFSVPDWPAPAAAAEGLELRVCSLCTTTFPTEYCILLQLLGRASEIIW